MTRKLEHNLLDPEESSMHTRRPGRTFRWPAIFVASLIGLLLLSQLVEFFKGSSLQHTGAGATQSSLQQDQRNGQSDGTGNNAPATFLTVDGEFRESSNTVLHSERTSALSPNSEWRVQLTDVGDIVLERIKAGASSPIWWTNQATYSKRLTEPEEVYATLDADGVLTTHAKSIETGKIEQLWTSSGSRLCSMPLDSTQISRLFPARPRTQALMVDDLGRLVIWSAQGVPTCVLSDQQHTIEMTDQSSHISMEVQQDEPSQNSNNEWEWPMYSNSSKYTHAQLRAMLQQDIGKRGMTFELTEVQLRTIYSDAIIVPSWHGHVDECYNFLRSMIRHCVDCDRWQINLILNSEDVALFQHRMFAGGVDSLSYWLPGLRIMVFEDMEYKHYAGDVDVANITKTMDKFLRQNLKKEHGCFSSGKRYCSLFDSESFFLRTTWYSDDVKDYLDDPFIIHNPDSYNGLDEVDPFSAAARDVMGVDIRTVGWLLSYYSWIFDAEVYSDMARIFAEEFPLVEGTPQRFFFEIGYYAYIWGKLGPVPGPQHKFITAREILGDRLYNHTWERQFAENGHTYVAIVEDARVWMRWYPWMLIPTAQAWNDNNLHLYKISGDTYEQSMLFLSLAKSVRICVSEQPRDVFEAAMMGIFNEI